MSRKVYVVEEDDDSGSGIGFLILLLVFGVIYVIVEYVWPFIRDNWVPLLSIIIVLVIVYKLYKAEEDKPA